MSTYEENNGIYIPKENMGNSRLDFMQAEATGSSKGKSGRDPIISQSQQDELLEQDEIDNIYKHKRIAQNIIDIPAEDATREWIDFEDTNEKDEIIDKLNDLNAQSAFQKMMEFERLTGDGFISIGTNQGNGFDISQPLEDGQINNIDYIHPFSKKKVEDGVLDDDPFSPTFNKFQSYELEPLDEGTRTVHSSRMLHMQTRVFEGDKWGSALMQALYEPITILDNFAWSLGQIAYSMTFKVLKSKDINMKNKEQVQNVTEELEKFFNSMSLAVIGSDDELTHEGPSGSLPNIAAMSEFIWDFICGSARMPKAHILGQQQGTITGGEYDSLNYYMRISGIQENYIRPLLEYLINLLYKATDSGIGSGSVEEPEYTMTFNPLWKLDKKSDAEIRNINSKIDERYMKYQVLSPDEVRENRFEKKGFTDELHLSDEELKELGVDINKLAKKVDEKRKQNANY